MGWVRRIRLMEQKFDHQEEEEEEKIVPFL
jgi:hypothetical protein